jgi:hypothetical protein
MIQETPQADLFKQQMRETNADHFLIIKEKKLTAYLAHIA